MSNIVLLDSRLHRKLRLHALPSARHGDDQRFVSVVLNEFPLLALHYPILFSKDADTEQFYCGDAGVRCRREFVLEEQRALTAYRPLNLQRRPFFTSGSELAIDLEHSRVAPSGEQELFTESGEPSNYLRSIMDLMRPAAGARAYAHFHANTVEPEADRAPTAWSTIGGTLSSTACSVRSTGQLFGDPRHRHAQATRRINSPPARGLASAVSLHRGSRAC